MTALLLLSLAFSFFGFSASRAHASGGGGFNTPGNVLISDQFNNRIVEVDRSGNIVWTFGSGDPTLCNPGPGTIIGLNDAERLSGGLTLTVALVYLRELILCYLPAVPIIVSLSLIKAAPLSGNLGRPARVAL